MQLHYNAKNLQILYIRLILHPETSTFALHPGGCNAIALHPGGVMQLHYTPGGVKRELGPRYSPWSALGDVRAR